jgi:competence protein ComGC
MQLLRSGEQPDGTQRRVVDHAKYRIMLFRFMVDPGFSQEGDGVSRDSLDRRGLTILETLVSISVMGVLVSLLVPGVASVRSSAIDAASLASLRTHAQIVSIYAIDHHDRAPYFADPDATFSVVRAQGRTIVFEYFGSSEIWPYALLDRYYGMGPDDGMGVFARRGQQMPVYQYSPTMISRPQFWNEATRAEGQLRSVRLSEIRYPGAKAVFVEWDPERGLPIWTMDTMQRNERWAFAFVDGSARRSDRDAMVRPYPRGEGTSHGARFNFGIVGMHTVDGVLGRDVR